MSQPSKDVVDALMAPPTEAHMALLQAIHTASIRYGTPQFGYIEHVLDQGEPRYEATEVIRSLPAIGFQIHTGTYSAIWVQEMGSVIMPGAPIGLTLLGLFHIAPGDTTLPIKIIGALAQWRRQYRPVPGKMQDPEYSFADIEREFQSHQRIIFPPQFDSELRQILEHEPATWGSVLDTPAGSWMVRPTRRMRAFEGVQSTRGYFEAVVTHMSSAIASIQPYLAQPAPQAEMTSETNTTDRRIELLREVIAQANEGEPEDFNRWRERAAAALRISLGADHELNAAFKKIRYGPLIFTERTPHSAFEEAQRGGVEQAIAMLEAASLEVEMAIQAGQAVVDALHVPRAHESEKLSPEDAEMANTVFIVHGHDTDALDDAKLTIMTLTGNMPTVLHEQPNRGQTLIEKFERHASGAGFVLVIATGDDVGRAKDAADVNARARQNVVFEYGYFIGAIGRDKVAILYDTGVELPSDWDGLVYIERDRAKTWRQKLAKEMRAAGIDADANKL